MDPNINGQNQSAEQTDKTDPARDDKYAQSLLEMTKMQSEMHQKSIPKKRLISTKKLVYISILIVTTIVSLIWTLSMFGGDNSTNTEQLLDGANYVNSLEK